jgi:hypothetical protein
MPYEQKDTQYSNREKYQIRDSRLRQVTDSFHRLDILVESELPENKYIKSLEKKGKGNGMCINMILILENQFNRYEILREKLQLNNVIIDVIDNKAKFWVQNNKTTYAGIMNNAQYKLTLEGIGTKEKITLIGSSPIIDNSPLPNIVKSINEYIQEYEQSKIPIQKQETKKEIEV